MEKLGITKLRAAIIFALSFTQKTAAGAQDGFDWTDVSAMIPDLLQVPAIVQSSKELVAEFKDLDEEERNELSAEISTMFDLPNDQTEMYIEEALKATLYITSLVNRFKGRV